MKRIATVVCFGGILVLIPAALGQRVEENNAAVTLNGAWTTQTDANASGGAYVQGNTAGASITFQFTGDSLSIYRKMDVDGGEMVVTIDNVRKGVIHCYFPEIRWQIPAIIENLGPGPHTLILTVNGTSPNGSTGTNVYFDAIESPQTVAPTAAQLAALMQVNQYRQQAGVPLAKLSTPVNLAAQGHAQYIAATGALSHDETIGPANFIGTGLAQRLGYFGCWQGGSEDAAQTGNPIWAVDTWMASVFHRNPILNYNHTDIGYGGAGAVGSKVSMDVMDFSSKTAVPPPNRIITTFPADKQTDTKMAWGTSGEGPNPFPAGSADPSRQAYGFPISVHIVQGTNSVTGAETVAATATGTLSDPAGNAVPVFYLDPTTTAQDPGTAGFLRDQYFMIPQQPLLPNTQYTARVTGTDANRNKFDANWQFTTGSGAMINSIALFNLQSTSVWVQWLTEGPVNSTQLNCGLTTAYGMNSIADQPKPTDGSPARIGTGLTGLTPATTYNCQVSAVDAAGVTKQSPNFTFTTLAQ